MWAADRTGCFEAAGLQVEMLEPPSKSANSLENVHAGKAELAINYPHNILLMREALPHLCGVGSMIKKNSEGLLSLKEKGIVSPVDLKGKTVGIGPSPVSRSQFEVFLTSNSLSYQDIELTYVGFEGEEKLLAGGIDALDAVQYAIPRTERKGYEVNFIPYTDSGVPDSPFLVFTGRRSWVEEHAGALKRFFSCLGKGFTAVKSWSSSEWQTYIDTIEGRNTEEEMAIWQATLPLIDDGGPLFLQNVDEITKLQQILFEKKLLENEYPVEEIFVNDYL